MGSIFDIWYEKIDMHVCKLVFIEFALGNVH